MRDNKTILGNNKTMLCDLSLGKNKNIGGNFKWDLMLTNLSVAQFISVSTTAAVKTTAHWIKSTWVLTRATPLRCSAQTVNHLK